MSENIDSIAWIAKPTSHRILKVSGPDAQRFLQGQLTCDVTTLKPQQSLVGAHCTPKGRMISSFIMCVDQEPAIWLRIRANLIDKAYEALKKYAVFSKVTLSKADADCFAYSPKTASTFGLTGSIPNTVAIHHEGIHELWGPVDTITGLYQKASDAGIQQLDEASLEAQWIASGFADIQAETSDAFLPQMLNYDALGGISYKKGCYTGQEIIARMHYKGQAKKHCYRLALKTDTPSQSAFHVGQPLYASEDKKQTVATIVSLAGGNTGETQALVVANDASVGTPNLFNDAGAIEICWLELPYAIPKI